MPETQKVIAAYLKDRGLTESKIDRLIKVQPKKVEDGSRRCPRCSSNKIRSENVEWTATTNNLGYSDEIAALDGLGGKATFKDQIVCNVCGYWVEDPNREKKKKSFWTYVADFVFGLFLSSR